MGERNIRAESHVRWSLSAFYTPTKNGNRRLTCGMLACVVLLASANYANAQSTDRATLSAIEKRLFLKEYDHDSDEMRIGRLEKQAFGEAMTGNLHERLEKVLAAIAPKKNPDGTVSGINPKEQPRTTAPAVNPVDSHSVAPKGMSNDRDTAAERAQLAVQAAREESINKLLDQGVQLWRAKRGPQAIEKFEEVLRLDPHNAQANFSMGVVYEASGNFAQAMNGYQRAAQEQPGNPEYSQALSAIEKKAKGKQGPGPAQQGTLRALAEDAKAAFDRAEYMSALSFYKELDDRVPNQALVKYNIGTCYMMTKNLITALEYYKQARKLKPDEPRYITAVDKLQANIQQAQSAREQVERAWGDGNTGGGQQPQGHPGGGPQYGGGQPQYGGGQQNAYGGGGGQVTPAKPKKQKHDNNNGGGNSFAAVPSGPNGASSGDPMAALGLIAKSGKGGVAVVTVGIASRASRVGLLPGDVIKAVDGTIVSNINDLNNLLSRKQPGAPVQMTVQRGKNLGQVSL